MDFTLILRGLIGLVAFTLICYLLSANKKKVNWALVISGIALQLIIAFLMIKVPLVRSFFEIVVRFFSAMISSSEESAKFLFGDLAKAGSPYGFAFFVLPTIIFFSALSSVLYYFGILQRIVYSFAWVMSKFMKLSGAESLAAAANVFIGQTEAPLVIKPYLEKMTRSELFCLMTGGMATIAGGVFGAYMGMLGGNSEEGRILFGMHLLTASVISAPAAIVCAKLMQPEVDEINKDIKVPRESAGDNFLDALARGTTDGLKLAVNVGAMLLAFMAMIYLLNIVLGKIGGVTGLNDIITNASMGMHKTLSLQYVLGYLFSPIAWLCGVDTKDIVLVGQLIGEKTTLNEFVSYLSLADMKNNGMLDQKSILIATYALCGFSNFASIGIQIGGIGSLAPNQRKNLTQLGFRALISGTIASLMTAAVACMIV